MQKEARQTIAMDREGSISKLLNPIEKHGTLIGIGAEVLNTSEQWRDIFARMATGNIHAPNLDSILRYSTAVPDQVNSGIIAAIGYILKDAAGGTLGKIGNIAYKAGGTYFVLRLLQSILYYSTHSDEGCNAPMRPNESYNAGNSPGNSRGYGGY